MISALVLVPALMLIAGLIGISHYILSSTVATRLNLRARLRHRLHATRKTAMRIDRKLLLSIAPTDDAGNAAPVSNVQWDVSDPSKGAVNTLQPDGFKAEFAPTAVGDVTITVKATNVEGVEIAENVLVTIEAAPVVATKLNLTAVEQTA